MANNMLIKLRDGINIRDLQNGSILVYDAIKNEFYTVSENDFFDKYESKLNKLLERYDARDNEMKIEIQNLRKQYLDFTKAIQENNKTLINMVEKFIKGE